MTWSPRSRRLMSVAGLVIALLGVVTIGLAGQAASVTVLGVAVVVLGLMLVAQGVQRGERASGGIIQRGAGPPAGDASIKKSDAIDAGRQAATTHARPAILAHEANRWMTGGDFLAPTLGELTAGFLRWFASCDSTPALWPAFDRWIRDTLAQFLQARHVRCFRVAPGTRRLSSMIDDLDNALWAGSTLPELVEHVVTTGRRYVRGAPGQGEFLDALIAEWSAASTGVDRLLPDLPVWMVPVRHREQTVGLLVVGELPAEILRDIPTLGAVAHLLELCWGHVMLADALRTAQRTDQASGVLSRSDLAATAAETLSRCDAEGEPSVVLALTTEGLRRLDDQGQWADRDWLIRQIGLAMRQRLRSDDLVGRFSDDCFVAVLRRLDATLGRLIAGKLLAAVRDLIGAHPGLQDTVTIRCALAEADSHDFQSVLAKALDGLQRGRQERTDVMVIPASPVRAAGLRMEAAS